MTAIEAPISIPATIESASLWRRLVRNPAGLGAICFLAFLTLIALVGPWIAPYDPGTASLQLVLASPSPEHWLGADGAGRDVLSRLLVATQVTLAAAAVAVVSSLVLGVVSGLVAGYFRGWFDAVSSWCASLVMALPGIVVLIAARSVLGPTIFGAMLVLGVILSPIYFRLTYTTVVGVRNELYVDAARVSGLGDARIIGRHILSVVRAPIIIQSAIVAGIAIGVQAGLDFIGLGDSSVPTWGGLLSDGFANIYKQPLLMLWPSVAIALTCVALTLLANAMRDALERVSPVRRRSQRRTLDVVDAPVGDAIAYSDAPAGPMRDVVLSVRELRVGYEQPVSGADIEVVHGVSLDIRRGEIHGLVGESGSGKSQTAFAVLGLLPAAGRVTAGSIDFGGIQLADAPERTYSRIRGTRIGYIPQEPMSNLDPSFRIGYQLVEPLRRGLGLSKKDATARALELLDRVGIPDPRRTFDAYPFEVSGGMAQRVLIAGAVSTDPELIIADEPTTALDVTVQAEVLDLLRDLQRERELSMLLVTHNFGVVADLCDRVSVMQQGRFVEQGTVSTILTAPSHPYTRSLLDAILDDGPARGPLVDSLVTTGGAR
ncbi:dipeptide/oligopeptide/nickel ABC transporter ATP-binding protein [Agromyces rhizosphaerae]|uniref:Dipeptide/oligopeptide/nickel ABC transporter ATP-binding protein n=1 Tax=Agromyces rhizosphaerae TaxID=88374 RepID=A0A9W6FQT4_9MICO|nr:dipeptide/oligopeptide/nickel ABC transporter permease/ATP-binding protein [Agromyces rhizosphaerae]GLI26957.1 dipeptide/oligopeptide/nickel ABC transporter ATP-binding protein [Agromyces rhizosphaerae]